MVGYEASSHYIPRKNREFKPSDTDPAARRHFRDLHKAANVCGEKRVTVPAYTPERALVIRNLVSDYPDETPIAVLYPRSQKRMAKNRLPSNQWEEFIDRLDIYVKGRIASVLRRAGTSFGTLGALRKAIEKGTLREPQRLVSSTGKMNPALSERQAGFLAQAFGRPPEASH